MEKAVHYKAGEVACRGLLYSQSGQKAPCILLASTFAGHSPFIKSKANALAELGFTAFVLDIYGDGKFSPDPQQCKTWMDELVNDRALLQERVVAGLKAAQGLAEVDSAKIAAIGFCFGGLCVLDLARSGEDLKGVVSFHGLLKPFHEPRKIRAQVLVLHGFEDPLVKPDEVLEFTKEMNQAKASWQIHMFGNTYHAFTNPSAQSVSNGMLYDEVAEKRSWKLMISFFEELGFIS